MNEEEYTPTWSREALLAGQAALAGEIGNELEVMAEEGY